MNPPPLPDNLHDLALWLCAHLEGLHRLSSSGAWEGRLPLAWNFDQIVEHIERIDASSRLMGVQTPGSRTIEFYPAAVGVYQTMDDLLHTAANRKTIPSRFTLLDPSFSYSESVGGAAEKPISVDDYFNAVGLWGALSKLADVSNGAELIFVESHQAQLAIVCSYDAQSIRTMQSLPTFSAEFCSTSTHADQKRSIVRVALIDHFKPRARVTLAEVIRDFSAIYEEVSRSYEMYMNEFSYRKIRDEISRQNLDDTLRLNKTLSDIQNQLLALPAAILLAGATLKAGEVVRNDAVLAAVWVFSVFMVLLVLNQCSSVHAIEEEIRLRRQAIEKLPNDSKRDLDSLFGGLRIRTRRQKLTLLLISIAIGLIAILSTIAVVCVNTGLTAADVVNAISSWVARAKS